MLRTVPGSSTDVGGVKVTTKYEKEVHDKESESSTSGGDSSYAITDLLSLRVSVCACACAHTCNFQIPHQT